MKSKSKLDQKSVRLLITIGLLIILLAVFSFINSSFLTGNNISSILREAAPVGIISIGMTFVIITGGIDLSVGSTLALTAMFIANLLRYSSVPLIPAILLTILLAVLCGFINGFVIVMLDLPDFIVALATMNIYRGITKMISRNDLESLNNSMIQNNTFKAFGNKILGIYIVVWLFLLVTIIGHMILRHTKIGLYTFAVGSNRKSAVLSGISFAKVKIFAYTLSGLLSGLAGIMICARMMTSTTVTGEGLEFNAIASVAVGGTSLNGGRGSVIGSFFGALMFTMINSGITQMGISSSYQYIIKGLIILAAMLFDDWFNNRFSAKNKKNG